MKTLILATAAVLTLSGCATPSTMVKSTPQPSSLYSRLTCAELTTEHTTVSAALNAAAVNQDFKAAADGASIGIGLVLPPMLLIQLISGGNNTNTTVLSNLKGQQEAIELQLTKQNCGPSTEMVAASKKREEHEAAAKQVDENRGLPRSQRY